MWQAASPNMVPASFVKSLLNDDHISHVLYTSLGRITLVCVSGNFFPEEGNIIEHMYLNLDWYNFLLVVNSILLSPNCGLTVQLPRLVWSVNKWFTCKPKSQVFRKRLQSLYLVNVQTYSIVVKGISWLIFLRNDWIVHFKLKFTSDN